MDRFRSFLDIGIYELFLNYYNFFIFLYIYGIYLYHRGHIDFIFVDVRGARRIRVYRATAYMVLSFFRIDGTGSVFLFLIFDKKIISKITG
jgi:hypothetical protein